jgi:hypothetical protein
MGFAPQLPTTNPTTLYFRGDGSYSPVTVDTSSLYLPWSHIINPPLATLGAPGLLQALNPLTAIPGSGSQTQVWCRGDDTWQTLPVTTYTNATFTLPVLGASTSVAVNPSPEWPQVASCVYVSDGVTRGFLECSATGTGPYTSVTLTNRGFSLNAAPGTLVNSGALLSLRGPSTVAGSNTGLVPTLPSSTPASRYLDGTGTWSVPGPLSFSASEAATGAVWLDGRKIYQKTIPIGALPNATSKVTAHGIINISAIVSQAGYSGSGISFIPLPYPHTTATSIINLNTDTTNVNIATGADYSGYSGYVTLQYTCTDR